MSRSWRSLWVGAGAALATLAGCATGQHPVTAPVSASAPTSAPASPSPIYYTGLRTPCPVLKSPEAKKFTGSRTAHFFPAPKNKVAVRIDCTWDPPSDKSPSLVMSLTFFQGPGIADDAAQRSFLQGAEYDVGRAETFTSKSVQAAMRRTPPGPTYFIADASGGKGETSDSFSQTTCVGNVVVNMTIFEKMVSGQDGKQRASRMMAELAGTTETIMAEVGGQLVGQPE